MRLLFVLLLLALVVMGRNPDGRSQTTREPRSRSSNSRGKKKNSLMRLFDNNSSSDTGSGRSNNRTDNRAIQPPIRQQLQAPFNTKTYDYEAVKNQSGPGELWHWPDCAFYWPGLPQHVQMPLEKLMLDNFCTLSDLKTIATTFLLPIHTFDEADLMEIVISVYERYVRMRRIGEG